MSKISPISGFLEFLPAEQKLFQEMMDIIRHHYELYGFSAIETPAVERVDTLLSKGGNEKEIYALRRLAAQDGEHDEKDLALHFDLTVPLARYVAQHQGLLTFPFKRYQMQPVWRGERPQAGRYRQFYQCDIDVIGQETLPLYYDAEVPAVMYRIFKAMNIGPFVIRVNNRKALQGVLLTYGIEEHRIANAIHIIDDFEKLPATVLQERLHALGMTEENALHLKNFFAQKLSKREWIAELRALPQDDLLTEGTNELEFVINTMEALGVEDAAYEIDPAIARGLDYYTGTIYETKLVNNQEIGSIASGGRYDDLTGKFADKKLPGVGMSIGLTRLLPQLIKAGVIQAPTAVGADVLVTAMDANRMTDYLQIGEELRRAGIKTEVFFEAKKFDKQMKFANKKAFKVVVIAGENELNQNTVSLKNMVTGEQAIVDRKNITHAVNTMLGK